MPTLAAWRRAFRAFGVDPTAYRSAAEALLRRLTKQGSIPSINALVDIGNLVAIRYGLPVAMFDQRTVNGGTTSVSLPAPSPSRTSARASARHPAQGEVIFIDDAGLVSARRWCWRQSAESASGPDTTEVLVAVEGHHDGAEADVTAAVADLEALLRDHAPRRPWSPALSPRNRRSSPASADTPRAGSFFGCEGIASVDW